jgi:hypothetical protein
MVEFHDINRVPPNGSLVLPLSLGKLHGHQSPAAIYDFLKFFADKVRSLGVDVVMLYTNGLYFNSDEAALSLRVSTTNQIVRHRQEFSALVEERREFMPQAFHFVAWDHVILNSDRFCEFLTRLERAYVSNEGFQRAVAADLCERGLNAANVRFVLEELTVTHLIRQKLVPLPTTVSTPGGWRLIAYAGTYLQSDLYLYQHQLLPANAEISPGDPMARSLYNYQERYLIDFKRIGKRPSQPRLEPQAA